MTHALVLSSRSTLLNIFLDERPPKAARRKPRWCGSGPYHYPLDVDDWRPPKRLLQRVYRETRRHRASAPRSVAEDDFTSVSPLCFSCVVFLPTFLLTGYTNTLSCFDTSHGALVRCHLTEIMCSRRFRCFVQEKKHLTLVNFVGVARCTFFWCFLILPSKFC